MNRINKNTVHWLTSVCCLLFLAVILSCRGDHKGQNIGTTQSAAPQRANEAEAKPASNESLTGVREAYVPPKAVQNPLTLGVANERVKSGESVCLNVQVADFNQLLSMQYSVRWDPKMLKFEKTTGYKLGGLGPEDFGAHRTQEGILTSVWIDENLQGVTLQDGATVYQICFQAIGTAGQNTEVGFSDGPTPFEVVNLKEEVVDIKGVSGKVSIY